ncbi:MAG: FAD-binding oxidoreductase [Beijerinckiaceae bacterium]|nr:FAD-binding oxidoreductase [Beijerinckiaceae bacterium]
MKLESYWLETAPPFTGASPLPVEGRADIVVVGGGFTGLSAARTLARKGVDVVVLEAGRVAAEASGRNGGHCNNGLAHDYGSIKARFGLERAQEMYRAFDSGVDLVERIVSEEGIDCDFVRSGKLKLAAKPEHFDKMRQAQDLLARDVDPETAILEPSDLRHEVGTARYAGGLLYRRSAMMHMGRFGAGLAHAAARAGARIHEKAAVTAITREAGGFRLTTARGEIRAKEVLLATGASQNGPFGWLRRRIVPVGSFIIVTEPLGENRARAIMPGRRTCTTSQNIGNYFRLTPDNRLIFGGRARFAMSNPTSDLKAGEILIRGLAEVFPQLGPCRIDYCWGGLVDMTQDRLPRAGTQDGMHFALGYSGHGVQMSTYMGDLMARRMTGEDVANPWRDLPWPAVPFHFGKPWFLPFVGLYYRYRDRVS